MKITNENREEILIAYLLYEIEDREAVENWINASDENRGYFEEIKMIWEASLAPSAERFDADLAWSSINRRIRRKKNYTWIAVAAIVVMLFSPFIWLSNVNEEIILATADSIQEETLIDGSVITLNENSRLTYMEDFNDSERRVKLEGEAFFDIERDTTKSFIIDLDKTEVRVLGTSFNINAYPEMDEIEVYVSSGLVLFSYQDGNKQKVSIELKAGDKVSYNKLSRELEKHQASEMNQIDMQWLDKNLVFDGVSLDRVAAVLEAVYDVEISFESELSSQCNLTAQFENDDVEVILQVIAESFGLEVEQNENSYLIKGVACE